MKSITNENNLGSSGGGEIQLVDINPDLIVSSSNKKSSSIILESSSSPFQYPGVNKIPVQGYDKINLFRSGDYYTYFSYRFELTDESFTTPVSFSKSGWQGWIDIPSNAVNVQVANTYSSHLTLVYSLLTDKQVIPTKVTADVNPDLKESGSNDDAYSITVYNFSQSQHFTIPGVNKIPVSGYKRVKIFPPGSAYNKCQYRFQLVDGTFTTATSFTSQAWTDWITIPENALGLQLSNIHTNPLSIMYSLSTTES